MLPYMVKNYYIIFLLFVLTVGTACWSDKGKNIPDVSNINIDFNINRFEKDLFSIKPDNAIEDLGKLANKYPAFYPNVFQKIMSANPNAAASDTIIADIIKHPSVINLYDTCMVVFKDFEPIEKEFKQAFQFYKYHFPNKKIPKVVSYVSEYSLGTFTLEEDLMGFGLDFFLGEGFPGYQGIFPGYIAKTMNKEHLVAKSMEVLCNELVGNTKGNRLLDIMIRNGKVLYILDHLLPYTPDHIKLAYEPSDIQWCQENELITWAHLTTEGLLYSTKMKDISKLVNQSPVAPPHMPQDAPGRVANWIGWQIIKAFKERNPQMSMEDLIKIENAQLILDKSKYKPR